MPDSIPEIRARLGAYKRWYPEKLEAGRKELAAAVTEKHIRRWIETGTLTADQRRELAIELLNGGDAHG